jgi:hypothetical protein
MYADGDTLAAARFSEDSIRRQLGYTIPPTQQTSGDITPRWRTGYWYTYTHPVTREDVVVWISGDQGFTHGYGYEYAGEEERYHNEDYAVGAGLCDEESATCRHETHKSAGLPSFG